VVVWSCPRRDSSSSNAPIRPLLLLRREQAIGEIVAAFTLDHEATVPPPLAFPAGRVTAL